MAAASFFSMSAETMAPYTEAFENASFRPKGWKQVASSSYSAATYTLNTEGGHTGSCVAVKQYMNTFSGYYGNYSYSDVLITPAVEGEVSLWVKKNGTDPTLTYYLIEDGATAPSSYSFKFVPGTDKNLLADKDITDWTKITVADVAKGTYIGIRANDILIDDFSATSADVVYRASLLASISNTTGGTNLNADADNKVTIKFKVELENDGDIDFAASDEGFKIDLVNAHLDNKVVGSGNITEAIPFGAKVSKEFEMTFDAEVAPGTTSNNYKVLISHALVQQPLEASLAWFTIIPYKPVPNLMLAEGNDANASTWNSVDINERATVGAGPAGTQRVFTLWNSGTAPLEVKSVSTDEGFATDAAAFTLEPKAKKSITVSLTGDPGRKDGKITFDAGDFGTFAYDLSGLVTKEDAYSETFEAEGLPAGWIAGNNWLTAKTPATLGVLGGTQWIEHKYTSLDKVISPKLSFEAGEQLHFMAAKTDNTSSTLRVYTSPDRVAWTEVLLIDTKDATDEACRFSSLKPTGTGYGTYEFKLFSAPMPEGETYIAFEAGGACIDNLSGGKLVPVNHDIYVSALSVPEKGQVNTRYITSITIANILAAPETAYKLALVVDGETVAEADETPELALNQSQTFDLRFTPHKQGEFTAQFVFTAGGETLVLREYTVDVEAEKAESEYQIGDNKITTSEPFNTFYNGSQCQIIYTPEMLDMDNGMKLTGVTFKGYNTDLAYKHVKVWAVNTDVTAFDFDNITPLPQADMTLVYDADYTFPIVGDNTAKVYEPVFSFDFNEPFEYTGGSVVLMFDLRNIEGQPDGKHVFFTVDNSAYNYWQDLFDNRVITQKKEFPEDLDDPDEIDWYGYRAGYPVTFFKVAKDVVTVNGGITDDFGKAVPGALVSLVSDDILYSAVADSEGNYSMRVANVNLTYGMTVEAELFDTYTKDEITFDAKTQPVATYDAQLAWTDRSATLTGTVENTLTNGFQTDAMVLLEADMIFYAARTDMQGQFEITVPDFTKEYKVYVVVDEQRVYTDSHKFTSKADTVALNIEYTGIDSVSVSAGTDAEYFNLQGVRIQPDALTPGIYIRRQGGTSTKITVK